MSVSVIIKWGGQEYTIRTLSEEDTVMDLKQSIKSLTGVLPERQKLLGLKVKGRTGIGAQPSPLWFGAVPCLYVQTNDCDERFSI